MKPVNEKLSKEKGIFDDLVKEIKDARREVVVDVLMEAIKRPGRQPRLTNAVDSVPVEEPKDAPRYRLPCRPMTTEEIGHFLSHPEEMEIVKDDKDGK